MTQNGPKVRFFEVIEKFGHQFFLHSCRNPVSRKYHVHETWPNILSANQIAGILMMNSMIFCELIQIQ